MPFKIMCKHKATFFQRGDVVHIVPSSYDLNITEDVDKWVEAGNLVSDFPDQFFILHVTNPEMDGTEAEVQNLLAPYDAFNPDVAYARRYVILLDSYWLSVIETDGKAIMTWETVQPFIDDRWS